MWKSFSFYHINSKSYIIKLMTKADMRVKKLLRKIRHALCKILSSTPELTDYNFTVGIIAKTAGVSQSTVRRRIREFERKSGTGTAGRHISQWTLFELFNAEKTFLPRSA